MPGRLELLAAEAASCTRCRLAEGRTNVVFGMGDPAARLMFVGEGPGAEEDRQGLPFVGRSGKLLDRLLLEELGITRDQVYIANVVKCRPPDNRDPKPDEIDACRPYLTEQLDLIRPAVVVSLGRYAAQWLLDSTDGITKLRGRAYPFAHGVLIPTLHPAAALRGGPFPLAQMRADFVRAKVALGVRRVTIELHTDSAEATRALAGIVAEHARRGDLIVLAGDLGAGKTTFVQGFAAALGISEPVTSPTFTLARTYEGRLPVNHVDVYRLDRLAEVEDLALGELIDGVGVTLVEWGDAIVAALPHDFLDVRIEFGPQPPDRTFALRVVGRTWQTRFAALATNLSPWHRDPPC